MKAIETGPPKQCNNSHAPGFFESFKSSITNIFHFPQDDCEEYYLITSISPALRVPPTEVSKTIGFNAMIHMIENYVQMYFILRRNFFRQITVLLTKSILFIEKRKRLLASRRNTKCQRYMNSQHSNLSFYFYIQCLNEIG